MIQAYNNLLASYPAKREVIYSSKNRNELKKVYSDIVNLSKRSPYYKINLSKENQDYAFGVKETALELKEKIDNMFDPRISGFQSKSLSISDEKVLTAKLLSEDTEVLPDTIEIKVNSLASVQINKGKELLNDSSALPRGEYDFSAKIMNDVYELTYVQKERTRNQDTLKNMADFLNKSLPGIKTVVEKGEAKDYSNLKITSEKTGRFGERSFSFEDSEIYGEGIVDFFGLNREEKPASYSNFELNGVEKQTATNTFALENRLHISLLDSAEKPITLRITADSEKILNAVDTVLTTYNSIIGLAKERTLANQEHNSASKLISEMKSLEKVYKEELTACGIKAMEDGTLKLEDSLAVQAAEDGGMESLFTRENGFISRLIEKSKAIAINPMEYLDKTIVLYPNSDKDSFSNPYVTSMYSGLFFNSYC